MAKGIVCFGSGKRVLFASEVEKGFVFLRFMVRFVFM
jgi:hypothetical protein